ncbi:hypothetical protein [Pseudomonas syringae]|uniref:hypothetical protein n=1 Tax=Pseudomonas syringae TaxID=317 RepID=UPI000209917F|nr:hypothetical protein [Pseudomonas syringae]MDP5168552.1 hypothetical protein [Pseudomonas syringae pv. aptata str. DSM 50252]
MKILIAIIGAILGAAGGYGTALMLSVGEVHAFTAMATAAMGGVILSATFSGIYSAFAAK